MFLVMVLLVGGQLAPDGEKSEVACLGPDLIPVSNPRTGPGALGAFPSPAA